MRDTGSEPINRRRCRDEARLSAPALVSVRKVPTKNPLRYRSDYQEWWDDRTIKIQLEMLGKNATT